MARTDNLRIKVDSKIKYALDVYADQIGVTTSALCAYVLGQFVHQQNSVVAPLLDTVRNQVSDVLGDELRRLAQESPEALASLDVERA